MANEFVARNGVIALNNSVISGSLTVTNGITGSISGTGSYAAYALSSSNALTSSFTFQAANAASASYALSASFAFQAANAASSSYALTASYATASSVAISASYATNAGNAGSASFATNASTAASASFATNASTAASASYALTASYATASSVAVSASFATSAANATSASIAANAVTASYVQLAASASYALSSSYALNASTAASASFATQAANASSASAATFASTASLAQSLTPGTTVSASNVFVTNNLTVNGTASFNYLQSVTGSAVIIGQQYIVLNSQTPAARFAGLQIYDSGSSNTTSSIVWDSERDNFVYSKASGSTYSGGGFLAGPRNTGSLGQEVYPTQYKLVRGQGGDHVYDSNITDNDTNIILGINTQITGTLGVTGTITGNLTGTASFATSASYAGNASNASSASYALNASNATSASFSTTTANATSASYATFANTASSANDFIVRGNVGIGTSNPTQLLEAVGSNAAKAIKITTLTDHATFFEAHTNSGSASNKVVRLQAQTSPFVGTMTDHTFDIVRNGTSIITLSGSNVGIGSTIPAGNLDVVGASTTNFSYFRTNGSTNRYILNVQNIQNQAQLDFRAHGSTYSETLLGNSMTNAVAIIAQPSGSAVFAVGTVTNNSLVLGTNNAERARIDNNGRVSINTTTTSWTSGGTSYSPIFNVEGGTGNTAYFNNTSAGSAAVTIASLNYFLSFDSGSVRIADFRVSGNNLNITAANHILLNPTSNVGIGTTTPAHKLVVAGTAGSAGSGIFMSTNDQGLFVRQNDGTTIQRLTYIGSDNISRFLLGPSGFRFRKSDDLTEVVTINTDGNVGIGTTNPPSLLHIAGGGIGTRGALRLSDQGTTNYWEIGRDNGTTGNFTFTSQGSSQLMAISTTGNVGINTTTPMSGTNNSGLQINHGGHTTILLGNGTSTGGVVQVSDNIKRVFIGANIYDDVTNSWSKFSGSGGFAAFDAIADNSATGLARILVGSGTDSGYASSNIFFEASKNNSTSYLALSTNTSNALYINNNGNVGINGITPTERLEISGSIFINSESAGLIVDSINKRVGFMKYPGREGGIYRTGSLGAQDFEIGRVTSGTLVSASAVVIDFYVAGDGNIGIGTTNPAVTLQVDASSGGLIRASRTGTGTGYAQLESDGTNGSLTANNTLYVNAGGSTRMTVLSGGNVGIGTTNPLSGLDVRSQIQVKSDTNEQLILDFTAAAGNYTHQSFRLNGVNKYRMFGYVNGDFALYSDTGSAYILYAKRDGNVGIGNTSPSATFSVSGKTILGNQASGFYVPSSTLHIASSSVAQITFEDFVVTAAVAVSGSVMSFGSQQSDATYRFKYSNTYNGNYATSGTTYVQFNPTISYINSGCLGIGNTSPGAKLQVNGEIRIYSSAAINTHLNYQDGGSNYISMANAGLTVFRNSSSDLVTILGGGNVGINSTSPGYKLDVASDSIRFGDGGSAIFYMNVANSSTVAGHINVGGSNRISILGNGNVGIGTSTPKAKLQVQGSISSELKYDGVDSGLVLYYPFAENTGTTTADRSQTGMIGTLTNGPTWVTSIMGYGLSLDGSNDYVSVAAPDTSVSFGTTMTYAMWIYPNSTVAQRYYLMDPRGDGSTGGMNSYFLFDRSNSTTVTFTVGNSNLEVISGNVTMGTGQWYHVAAVRNGSNWKVYLNGVEVVSGTTNTTALTLSNSFRIGTFSGAGAGPQYYFNGNIDEAKIWNRNLSANEVMLLYQQGIGTTSPYTNASGYVGISTTTVTDKLEVRGADDGITISSLAVNRPVLKFINGSTTMLKLSANGIYGTIADTTGDLMFFKGGSVGIGSTAPAYKLDVNGTSYFNGTMGINGEGNGLTIDTGYGNNGRVGFMKYGGFEGMLIAGNTTVLRLGHRTDSDYVASGGSPSIREDIYIAASGNVGIGTTNPNYKLRVQGDIYASADVIAYSDARAKDNVKTVENALAKVTSLRGVTYTRNDIEDKSTKMGVIAQEVLEVLPEVVKEGTDGYYSVAYGNMVGILIEAIKEQQKQIDELKYLLQTQNK